MPNSVLGVLFLGIGALLVLASALWAGSTASFVAGAGSAPGKVVALNAGGSHPEIEFTPEGSTPVQYPQGGLIAGYAVGDDVQVLYAPDDPIRATIDNPGALYGFPLIGLAMGLIFASVGWMLRRTARGGRA